MADTNSNGNSTRNVNKNEIVANCAQNEHAIKDVTIAAWLML